VISLPLTLLAMLPAALAVRFGRRAHRAGRPSARWPTVIGALALAYWGISFVLSLIARAIA
jgi:hypothetical protein